MTGDRFARVTSNRTSFVLSRAFLLAAIFCSLPSAGCAPVLIGTAGAVAGYAVSRDSVIVDMDHPWDRAWGAARQELSERGQIKRENPKRGRLDARIEEADVVVALKQLTPSTVRVIVRARKNLLPKVDVAQRVALGIQKKVESGSDLL